MKKVWNLTIFDRVCRFKGEDDLGLVKLIHSTVHESKRGACDEALDIVAPVRQKSVAPVLASLLESDGESASYSEAGDFWLSIELEDVKR